MVKAELPSHAERLSNSLLDTKRMMKSLEQGRQAVMTKVTTMSGSLDTQPAHLEPVPVLPFEAAVAPDAAAAALPPLPALPESPRVKTLKTRASRRRGRSPLHNGNSPEPDPPTQDDNALNGNTPGSRPADFISNVSVNFGIWIGSIEAERLD